MLIDQDAGTIEQDVMQEKAYPELRQKYNIFVAWEELELAEEELLYNYQLSGRYMTNYQFKVQIKLIKLFNYLKMMIYQKIEELKGIVTRDMSEMYQNHLSLYQRIEDLEEGKIRVNIKSLFELKNFIIHYMHECNLSNLLRKEEDDLDAFEKEYS